ncbi:hypothetical protein BAY61_01960 [Prauserella marina]|uniref:Uncharacterized protein n=1 Tax=Prauserella marina TaxID=530584 RepID=A0A222VJ63_9PSEU|nr:DUF5667 domain-containing protein [Prauserella marina]ASR33960.1 hypothetical protein BAY61_01960 [Prauserella marina]PWV82568.1 hypothetical protein DES30_102811 [Prauserella marina]SDC72186.1 hypothetical protein SAMN05421630_103347 [Prauserella marina]
MRLPRWSPARRDEHERFARALDDGDRREFGDELAVVAALRGLGDPNPLDERVRTRIAERVTREASAPRRRRGPYPVVAAGIALVVAATGLGLLLSEDAVPGDPLYHLKRAGETAVIGLTFDEEAKATKHLEFAAKRLDELSAMARQGPADPADVARGLSDFANQTKAGVAPLVTLATSSDGRLLGVLRSWAADQTARLASLGPSLGTTSTAEPEEPSSLLVRIEQRAEALIARMNCYQITSGEHDELGALPAAGACAPPPDGIAPVPEPDEDPLSEIDTDGEDPPRARPVSLPTPAPTATVPTLGERATSPTPHALPAPISATPLPRLPDSAPEAAPLLTIPPLLPGLPEVSIG